MFNLSFTEVPWSRMRYSPPLDGIRAIAILAVLAFHVSPAALRGGFTGVDVFFVLSGFLITSIILHDLRESTFSLREFYLRRIQRLLPNVVLTVLGTLLLWTIFMPAGSVHQVARHGLWTIFNLSNVYIYKYLGGYWGTAAEWSPLTHTWSLGVEEQFYLVFPGLLLLLARFQPRRVRLWLIVGSALSFALCVYRTHPHPLGTFYLLPTRIWELTIGASLAATLTPLLKTESNDKREILGGIAREAIGLTGLVLILLGFFLIRNDSGFPGIVSILPTGGTWLVLFSISNEKTRLARFLSTSFMVRIGKLSYSIYLWHWPLITLGKALAVFYGKPELYGSGAGCLAGILLAWAAYVFVEQPLRRRGPGRLHRFAILAAGFVLVLIGCGAVLSRPPVADPNHVFDTPEFFGEEYTAGNAAILDAAANNARLYDVYHPPIDPRRPTDLWRKGGVIRLYGAGNPQVVVLGSSHALMYGKVIDDICRKRGLSVAFLSVDGSTVFFDTDVNFTFTSTREAHEFDETRKAWIRKWRPSTVFIIDRWDSGFARRMSFETELHTLLEEVSPSAGRVIFVAQVPSIADADIFNLRELAISHLKYEKRLPALTTEWREPFRERSISIAEAEKKNFSNLRVLRPDVTFFNQDGTIRYTSGRSFYYADGDHLSEAGAEVVSGLFEDAIAEANPEPVAKTR
jgi:peptidoglycan/LPS O-acetylase OafA/YrhL